MKRVYELLEHVGQGGFADVYRARCRSTGAIVAMKVLREAWDPSARARFESEANRQLRAAGPLVVPVLDRGVVGGKPFLVMPLLARGSLAGLLERERAQGAELWEAWRAINAIRGVAEALAGVHAVGIAHLDVKPANILIGHRGELLLTDFGCAATQTAEQTAAACATDAYAAPEQFASAGVKSDIYPLGVMLHELLVGSRLPKQWWIQPAVIWPSRVHTCGLGVEVDGLVRRLAHPSPAMRPTAFEGAWLLRDLCARVARGAA